MSSEALGATEPVPQDLREILLDPFIAATSLALAEMARTEVVVQAVYRQTSARMLGDVSAVLAVQSERLRILALSFPERTALALTRRVLAGVTHVEDRSMVHDCIGEIANVIAGQGKALLSETPYHYSMGTPRIVSSPADPETPFRPGVSCLVIAFASDAGDFALQLEPLKPDVTITQESETRCHRPSRE